MDRQSINKKFDVTEAQLDEWAAEYESGTWDAPLGKLVTGRPSIADEEVRPVTFRLPVSKIATLDKQAASRGETRSEFLRDAVDRALLSAR
jgi:transposase